MVEKDWLNPMEGLRKEVWLIKLTFGESINGSKTIKEFKKFTIRLNKKYGNRAYHFFTTADLSLMVNFSPILLCRINPEDKSVL